MPTNIDPRAEEALLQKPLARFSSPHFKEVNDAIDKVNEKLEEAKKLFANLKTNPQDAKLNEGYAQNREALKQNLELLRNLLLQEASHKELLALGEKSLDEYHEKINAVKNLDLHFNEISLLQNILNKSPLGNDYNDFKSASPPKPEEDQGFYKRHYIQQYAQGPLQPEWRVDKDGKQIEYNHEAALLADRNFARAGHSFNSPLTRIPMLLVSCAIFPPLLPLMLISTGLKMLAGDTNAVGATLGIGKFGKHRNFDTVEKKNLYQQFYKDAYEKVTANKNKDSAMSGKPEDNQKPSVSATFRKNMPDSAKAPGNKEEQKSSMSFRAAGG